ncbi:uncharacterized protein LOC120261243 [Dioscorea cayenensis subsp. rotundata]|uniref:Uncharacterized protein LOC120261243 n=1 Tax=Dioscorea cayennensis subsp. rotundata TaxID=55577 RepID=A0AB40BEA1_DIOCR|nr:uncharacterized protein LOC120261243 [Dioscorea cayenensis subsp. rotundata]
MEFRKDEPQLMHIFFFPYFGLEKLKRQYHSNPCYFFSIFFHFMSSLHNQSLVPLNWTTQELQHQFGVVNRATPKSVMQKYQAARNSGACFPVDFLEFNQNMLQMEVQKHLQLRIEAQGKYLQSVLQKAQEKLAVTDCLSSSSTDESCLTSSSSSSSSSDETTTPECRTLRSKIQKRRTKYNNVHENYSKPGKRVCIQEEEGVEVNILDDRDMTHGI